MSILGPLTNTNGWLTRSWNCNQVKSANSRMEALVMSFLHSYDLEVKLLYQVPVRPVQLQAELSRYVQDNFCMMSNKLIKKQANLSRG